MANEDRIGARVAAIRKLRGLTGRELARRASVSYSLLAKVESGAAPATPAFIGAVARALRVDVPKITGQPYKGRAAVMPLFRPPLTRCGGLFLPMTCRPCSMCRCAQRQS